MNHLTTLKYAMNRWSKCCASTYYLVNESLSIFSESENITQPNSSITKICFSSIRRILPKEIRLGPLLSLRRGILAAKTYVQWCDEALLFVAKGNHTSGIA